MIVHRGGVFVKAWSRQDRSICYSRLSNEIHRIFVNVFHLAKRSEKGYP